MWTFISLSLAIGINFFTPAIPGSIVTNQKYLIQFGYPH